MPEHLSATAAVALMLVVVGGYFAGFALMRGFWARTNERLAPVPRFVLGFTVGALPYGLLALAGENVALLVLSLLAFYFAVTALPRSRYPPFGDETALQWATYVGFATGFVVSAAALLVA